MNKSLSVFPYVGLGFAGVICESLEPRALLSFSFQFDYRYDTSGFFNTPARKDALVAAGKSISGHLGDHFTAVKPSGGNTWLLNITNPHTGGSVSIADATIASDTVVVFVGARDLSGSTLGQGGPAGWSASGTSDWVKSVRGRGQSGATATPRTDFAPKAGVIAFDSLTNWFFSTSIGGIVSSQTDFYSVAAHELGHVLGIGAGSETWPALVKNGAFTGPKSEAIYGGPVPLTSDHGHFAEGTSVAGHEAALDPTLKRGKRKDYTPLDFAALDDIGWDVFGVTPPPATTGKITGTLFNDANADGVKNAGDGALAGWRVFVDKNHDGQFNTGETATTTDSSGNYTLTTAVGPARVVVTQNAGYRRTAPSAGNYDVTVTAGGTAGGKNFGYTQKVLLTGSVFKDANGNGVKDSPDTGLAGWRVFLDKDNDGVFDSGEASTVTASTGAWTLATQSAGAFVVRVVQQGGYTLNAPSGKSYAFSLTSGQSKTGLNFAEKPG